MESKSINVENRDGDFKCQTKQELEALLRESAGKPFDDVWIYGESEYPCLAMLLKGDLACIHYFLDDNGDMWQSVGNCGSEVNFVPGSGEEMLIPGECVITLDQALACAGMFFDKPERPDCIAWRDL